MKILKFGSATIATATKIQNIAQFIKNEQGNIIVLSSIKGHAEYLEEIAQYYYNKNIEGAYETLEKFKEEILQLIDVLFVDEKSKDDAKAYLKDMLLLIKNYQEGLFTLFEKRALMAQGELLSTKLFNIYLSEIGIASHIIPALEYMKIDRGHNPDMNFIKPNLEKILQNSPTNVIYITQGYICRNSYGEIDDLRKGGSDYTAAIIGAVLQANEIQIFGENDVIYNNDKLLFPESKVVSELSFDEAAELAYFGSKILHPTCIYPAKMANIPVRMKSINNIKGTGTLISNHTVPYEVKAIGSRDNITNIQIKSGKMLLAHGFLRKVFEIFERYETSIDMLATSEIGISLTIDNDSRLKLIHEDLMKLGNVTINNDMVIVSIIGDKIMQSSKLSEKIMDTIKMLPMKMLSYGGSEHNLSFLIAKDSKTKALNALNDSLF